jgi:GT2 family glycosyltransferase
VRRNLDLLSQTIGGDFHVGFDDNSIFSRRLTNFLKRWRYQGHYYGNSGIFVRRDAFEAIGGFGPDKILEDYQFARRMEKYGPTLYLPDTITASARKFRQRKIRATLAWVTAQALHAFGWHSEKVTRACLQTSR